MMQWEETQDSLRLNLARNMFGMHAPMRQLMERKIVASVRLRAFSTRPLIVTRYLVFVSLLICRTFLGRTSISIFSWVVTRLLMSVTSLGVSSRCHLNPFTVNVVFSIRFPSLAPESGPLPNMDERAIMEKKHRI